MLKHFAITMTAATVFATTASTAVAHGSWAFDDPYWKQQLQQEQVTNRSSLRDAGPFAAAPRDTVTDAAGESSPEANAWVEWNQVEKRRRNAAGFPQYNP